MKFGVVTFPGSNCDYDSFAAVKHVLGENCEFLWHKSENLLNSDVVILPGGFSYGDYLRAGAISKFSPIMEKVIKFAHSGGIVIGICNGFQVLTECGLLPGALIRNDHLRFSCKQIYLKVVNNKTPFTVNCLADDILMMPIAHGEGNYYHFADEIKKLENENRVVFRYCDKNGNVTDDANPNGSINNIAGIINKEGNVLGMMPHPERAVESILNSTDGFKIFESLKNYVNNSKVSV